MLLLQFFFTFTTSAAPLVVIVVGASGEAEYGKDFTTWADRWADAATRGSNRVVQVGRDASPATARTTNPTNPTTTPTTRSLTDHDHLQSLLSAESSEPAEPLWLVLIGHGTFDGKETKFNLRGPDFSDVELAAWLKPFKRPVAVIDCSSSSAPFLNRLSARNRVVITATRSGSELQYSRFGEYISAILADSAADLDKDGQTSLLEAFLAASHRVEEFYKQGGRLTTEHALLDDNGDALGISADWFKGYRATRAAKDGAAIDGPRAHQWILIPSLAEQALSPELRTRRDQLDLAIESLRQKKAKMPEAQYYAQLENLLMELARVYQQADGAGAKAK